MVKLKLKIIKTKNPDEVERAKKYGQIVRTRGGSCELLFPTKLNEKLKPYLGKDFNINVVKEGETLRVILTHNRNSKTTRSAHSSVPCKPNDKRTGSPRA
jgi:hypothetical protein